MKPKIASQLIALKVESNEIRYGPKKIESESVMISKLEERDVKIKQLKTENDHKKLLVKDVRDANSRLQNELKQSQEQTEFALKIISQYETKFAEYQWISIEEKPPPSDIKIQILVSGKNNNGKLRHIASMAYYIGKRETLAEDWLDDECPISFYESDFDKENDCFWTPAGFYEYQMETERSYFVSTPVTHWKLIILPDEG